MYKKLLSLLICTTLVFLISITSVFASEINMIHNADTILNNELIFPIADGVDYGLRNEKQRIFMSSYEYITSGFKSGVYLDGGNSFPVNRKNNPYFIATHNKSIDNNPNLYRVSYQAIYDSSGEIRQGIPFLGPLDGVKVQFSINETDDFRFYIAGDGTSTYTASGKLYYGGF